MFDSYDILSKLPKVTSITVENWPNVYSCKYSIEIFERVKFIYLGCKYENQRSKKY